LEESEIFHFMKSAFHFSFHIYHYFSGHFQKIVAPQSFFIKWQILQDSIFCIFHSSFSKKPALALLSILCYTI